MGFAKQDRRPFDPRRPKRFALPRLPPVPVVRIVLLAIVSAVAAGWALAHHYSVHFMPMEVPATPRAAPTFDADAGELPVPEVETAP